MVEFQQIRLATKPTAQITYSFHAPVSPTKPVLVVFLNGLGLPQTSWLRTIAELKALRQGSEIPAILTYDRFGQGQTTDRDPSDEGAADPSHGHDALSVIHDLRQLIRQIASEKLGVSGTSKVDSVTIVLVANSIGGALARLYAQEYPGTVAGLLLLDSILANSDFISVIPDADAEGFDASSLPPGITTDDLRTARERIGKIFHPDVGNKEGLSRRNLRSLLPASDGPMLQAPSPYAAAGSAADGPYVTVVGHDFETFAEESQQLGQPKAMTMAYLNPYWHRYNQGLVKITQPERARGPLQAPNSGHFIQKDNPVFVAQELNEILSKIL